MRYLLLSLLLAPLAAWAQAPADGAAPSPSANQNRVTVEQFHPGRSQTSVIQSGSANVAIIRQGNPTDSGRVAPVVVTSQTSGGQTIIRQTQGGQSIYIRQTGPAASEPTKKSSRTNPK